MVGVEVGWQWAPMIVLRLGPKLFSFIANLLNWSKQVSAAELLPNCCYNSGRCFMLKVMSRTIVTQRTTLLPPGINSRQVMLVRQVVSSREPPLFSCSGKVATGAKLGHNRSCHPSPPPKHRLGPPIWPPTHPRVVPVLVRQGHERNVVRK